VLFQVFYVIPTIRNREVEAKKTHQEEIVFSITRELDTDLKQTTGRQMELSKRTAFQRMDLVAMQDVMTTIAEGSFCFESLSVMNAEGCFVCSTAEDFSLHETNSYADRPYFTVPFEQGQVHFGTPPEMPIGRLIAESPSITSWQKPTEAYIMYKDKGRQSSGEEAGQVQKAAEE